MKAIFLNTIFKRLFPRCIVALLIACGVSSANAQVYVASDGLVINSCSGTFYDSGGAAGNYGNSETFTVVLCPTGGSGAGPASSVTFTQFAVQPLAGADILVVYNGATTAAPILATGSSTNDLTGQSFLATGATGCLTFQWTSNATIVAAGWAATITTGPEAGVSGTLSVCENGAAFDLITVLTGNPDTGGAWTDSNDLPVSATFTPGSSLPGVYTYTVLGSPPCAAATATATITQVAAPNAGGNGTTTICSNSALFQMLPLLTGTPAASGSWTGPTVGTPHAASYNPATDVSGVYTYTVAGTAPCAAASATLTVTERSAPNAGTNGSARVCSTNASFQLVDSLGGTADTGGTWTAPGGATFSGTFVPGTSVPGAYVYTVTGQPPCAPATATVTVVVNSPPNPGINNQITKCSNDGNFSLFAALGGSPAAGGTWKGPDGLSHPVTFNMATDVQGAYTYTVAGTAPCASASAVVTVTIVQQPIAGTNGSFTTCANGPSFPLLPLLGGSPNVSGTWTAPGGAAHSGTFVPGTSVAGIYTYTVSGVAPCSNAQATVTITVVPPANAGTNGSLTICSDASSVNLFTLLGGSPATTGTWKKPDGTTHSGTYLPATQPGGAYTYTVTALAPCANAIAVVQVDRLLAPDAGTNGSVTVCNTNGPFDLITVLGGSPSGSGTWFGPSMTSVLPSFIPGTSAAGVYTYVVQGTAPCVNDTARATVNVVTAPNAGTNGTVTVCSNDAVLSLFSVLGGTPTSGGTWTRPDGTALPNGNFVPGISQVGGYTYTVLGQTPCLSASAVVVVNQNRQPVAGISAAFQRCSTEGPVQLFNILTGSPDPGGTWTGPGGTASTGVFIPGTSTPGIYTYSLTGTAPCTNASATVTATVNPAPNAGTDGNATVCADLPSINLFTLLGGNPDNGGTWSATNSTGHLTGSTFTPPGLAAGNYNFTYTVPGIGQCVADVANVQVVIVPALNAGTNGSLTVCKSNDQVNLFTGLTGSPQTGGTWTDLSLTGALTGQVFNATLVSPGTYTFTYTLAGSPSCTAASAQVAVTVVAAPSAGQNGSFVTCSNSAAFSMFPYLGGSPQGGGTWTLGAVSHPNTYNPATDISGIYTYSVPASGPCPSVSATVTITEVIAPNAGRDTTRTVCSNGTQFNMTSLLPGNPQAGTWSFSGQPHGPLFVPGVDISGVYIYTVQGQSGCANATTSLTVTVQPFPSAGGNVTLTVCSDGAAVQLSTILIGEQPGGNWTGPTGLPNTGLYTPGTSIPGPYVYTIGGTGACASNSATVTVVQNRKPVAGISGSLQLCSTSGSVQLITGLTGTPDNSGTWTGPGGVSNGVFVPGTSATGTYVYTVPGVAPCVNSVAQVTVSLVTAPNAGGSASIAVCSNSGATSMIASLPGAQSGGVWTGPGSSTAIMNGIFIAGTTAPGTYTYTVAGTGSCPPATAQLTVTVNQAVEGGVNANPTVCSNSGQFAMFPLLGSTATPGGTWKYRLTGASNNGTFIPGTSLPGIYVYTVVAPPGCANDSAIVNVTVNQQPFAGNGNVVITICDNVPPFPLSTSLSGTPVGSSFTWTGPNGSHSGTYVPSSDDSGVYTFTASGVAPCASRSVSVTVNENHKPNAGGDGVLTVCSSQATFPLISGLSGSPEPGGSWYHNGVQVGDNYVPGSAGTTPGIYSYVITATAPCTADTANLNIIQFQAANAGINTVAPLCSGDGLIPLIDLLGGTPNATGSWMIGLAPHGPILNTATDIDGAYQYTVQGIGTCPSVTSQVQVTISDSPNAGENSSLALCLNTTGVNLLNALLGTPTPGGVWINVNGAGQLSPTGILNTTGVNPGTYNYRYVVLGAGSCDNDTAHVAVQITNALDAGNSASVSICETEVYNLINGLGGTPQTGGVWTDLDGSGGLVPGTGVLNAAGVTQGIQYRFKYKLPASASCQADSAIVTVTVAEGPNAGSDGNVSLCSSSASQNLFTLLGNNPDNTGSWFTSTWVGHSATFVPGTDAPGTYNYIVGAIGNCGADTSKVTVNVLQAANAGIASQNYSICSNSSSINLFTLLGSNANVGGTWTFGNNVPHNQVYNPVIDAAGTYTYTVLGSGSCPNATAIIIVSEPVAPFAGISASATFCSSAAPVNMRTYLGSSAQAGGTWIGPGGPHSESFNPASDAPGNYTYVVAGTAPCVSDSAVLAITVIPFGNAGVSVSLGTCTGVDSLNVFAALGPNASIGGAWTDVNSSGALSGNVFNPSSAGEGVWILRYSFAANAPCPASSAEVTVTVGLGSNPGGDSTVTVCGSITNYALINALSGSPDLDGVWSSPSGQAPEITPEGILNATLVTPGVTNTYVYTTTHPECGELSSAVTVTISAFPNAGIGGSVQYCTTSAPIDLFAQLGGSPEPNGTWTGPLPGADGFFDPSTDPAGNYSYTIPGNSACAAGVATLALFSNSPANPGTNGSVVLCDTLVSIGLLQFLNGTPQSGGLWQDLNAAGGLTFGNLNTTDIQPGTYGFQYTINVPGCGPYSSTLSVDVVSNPRIDTAFTICNAADRTYTVLFNILGGDTASYVVSGAEGSINAGQNYTFTSTPVVTSAVFEAFITDAYGCGAYRVVASSPCNFFTEIFIPETFSPNGDGINEAFIIPGIEGYPGNSITIFNRWGAKVFAGTGYDNSTVVWNGSSDGALIGDILPTGTYFYVLDLGTRKEPFTGYIYLNR